MPSASIGPLTSPPNLVRRKGIALCLSGGGYRAALFHLGALRRLHELQLFPEIRAISSVSGGSIVAAFLADRVARSGKSFAEGFSDWQSQVSTPFRRLAARDIRTWPFFSNLLWNWVWPTPRVRYLQSLYRRLLTRLSLADLPAQPNFILCATDLIFGANWEFSRGRCGSWQAGYVRDAGTWPLARAVAASSAFPPSFGPLGLQVPAADWTGGHYQKPGRDQLRRRMALSDGGVYDNMGLEPVWLKYERVLVSDGGAPFQFSIGDTPWRRLLRYTAVVTYQTRVLRRRMLFDEWNAHRAEGCYWTITSGVEPAPASAGEAYLGYSQALASEVLGRVRTDLDSFDPAEMSVLENHGYFAAERSLRRHQASLIPADAAPPVSPYPEWEDEAKVRRALRNSGKLLQAGRLLRGLLQGP